MDVVEFTTSDGVSWSTGVGCDSVGDRGQLAELPEVEKAREARYLMIHEMLSALQRLRKVMVNLPATTYCPPQDHVSEDACITWAQSDEAYWLTNEGLTSERIFHRKLYFLVKALVVAYQESDIDAMCDVVRRLLYVDDYINDEPLQSIYVTGLVHGLLVIARACIDYFQVEDSYTVVEHCAHLLEAKRERRQALRLSLRPDSECWYRLYELLAELKWKGPHADRNHFISPDQLIIDFQAVEDRCLDYIQSNPSSDSSRNQRVLTGLGWAGLQTIKMASLWCQDRLPELIQRFNEIHKVVLSEEVGHFQRPNPGNRNIPWYWDFELFKWCVHGPAAPEEALLCHQWRLDAVRSKRNPDVCLNAFELASNRELEYLLNPNIAQEVPSAC